MRTSATVSPAGGHFHFDVTTLHSRLKTATVNAYGRYIIRNPEQENSLDALLQLPLLLWPSEVRADLDGLKSQIGDSQLLISFGELSGRLKSAGALNRSKTLGLANALESLQIGMEIAGNLCRR